MENNKIIKWIFNLIKFAIIKLDYVQNFIEKKYNYFNKYEFDDLTSNIDFKEINDNQKTYLDSIKWAVQNNNIKNIALTGFYGTGKSTILNIFKKRNKSYKYLQISLSTFSDSDYTDDKIESSILQQIFYSKKHYILSESRLKRIKNKKYFIGKAFFFILWVISIIYIFFPNILLSILCRNESFGDLIISNFTYEKSVSLFLILVFLIGAIIIISKSFKEVINLKLNKLSIKDLELIPKDSKDDLLNKNLDEIIYFFEKTNVNIVFIEDLDRFEKSQILIKLRELNSLINNCEDIKNKVTFIYAIKDEMFSLNNERAKFFDFIIPIIPIINYENSYEILKPRLTNYKNISDDFLKNVSPYLNDMRTLKNILNEFKIYEKILNFKIEEIKTSKDDNTSSGKEKANDNIEEIKTVKDDFNSQKLLALIIYKNYYPKDFSDVQQQKGILYSIFEKKETLFNDIKDKIENEIKAEELHKKMLNEEKTSDINMLRKEYIYELLIQLNENSIHNVKQILDVGITFNNNLLLVDENFNKLTKTENIRYCTEVSEDYWEISYGSYTRNSNISFKTIETKVNKNFDYFQRANLINEKNNNKIASIDNKILLLQNDIKNLGYLDISEANSFVEAKVIKKYINSTIIENNLINTKTISNIDNPKKINKELLENESNDEIQFFEKTNQVTNYKLLETLLIEGYVDEHFINYISYFYEGSLTADDNNLKKKIIEQEIISFDHKIDNTARLVEKLAVNNFKKQSVLNYEILEYLLNGDEREKLKLLLDNISKDEYINFEFIKGFIMYLEKDNLRKNNLPFFINIISNRWNGFWEFLCKNNLDSDILEKVLSIILVFQNSKEIENQKIIDYINNSEKFLEIFKGKIDDEELLDKLKYLKIKFKNIKYFDKRKSLFEKIYLNNLFEINSAMIFEILSFLKIIDKNNELIYTENDIYNSNYTSIISSRSTSLINYIESQINLYVNNVFLNIETNINESEDSILRILKIKELDVELIPKILLKENNKLTNITDIREDYWDLLFENNKIKPNWLNLIVHYERNENFSIFVNYLNLEENYLTLSRELIITDEDNEYNENTEDFIKSLLNSTISNDSFSHVVNSIEKKYDDISILEVENHDIISIMISTKKINLTQENLDYLETIKSQLNVKLIEQNEDIFTSNFNDYSLPNNLIYNIITSNIIKNSTKDLIIEKLDSTIQSFDKSKLNEILNYLLKSNFINYSYDLYVNLLKNSSNINDKVNLVIKYFEKLDDNEITETLNLIDPEFEKINNEEKVNIPLTHENIKLLELLKGKKIKNFFIKKTDNCSVSYY